MRNPYEHDGDPYNPPRPQWQLDAERRDREQAQACERFTPRVDFHVLCSACGAPRYAHRPETK